MKKKRWACFLLALLMVIPVSLTGCSEKSGSKEIDTDESIRPKTITLYGITGESTTQEAIAAVQEAMNVFTEGQFNTHVVLKLYPEAEYYDVIDAKMDAIDKKEKEEAEEAKRKKAEARELKKKGITTEEETTVETSETEVETYVDRYGIKKTVYPDEKEYQFDIFMVQGYDRLSAYENKGVLSALDSALTSTVKLVNKYVNSKFLSACKIGGSTVAIPNNILLGEYTYLLINRELCDKYYYSPTDLEDFTNLYNFLLDMDETEAGGASLYNMPAARTDAFLGIPLIGTMIEKGADGASFASPKSLLSTANYRKFIAAQYDLKNGTAVTYEEGDMGALPEGKHYTVACLKGGPDIVEKYSDEYYVTAFANPFADARQVPGTCFCVSTYAADVDRCAEVIAALSTSAYYRNLFQYGVENVHYTLDDATGYVVPLNNDYSMKPEDTGNMFLLTPNVNMSAQMLNYAENDWALAKKQNQDLQVSPYLGFAVFNITKDNFLKESNAIVLEKNDKGEVIGPKTYPFAYTADMVKELGKISDKYQKKIDNFKGLDDDGNPISMLDYLKQLNTEMSAEEMYVAFMDKENNDTPLMQYINWIMARG